MIKKQDCAIPLRLDFFSESTPADSTPAVPAVPATPPDGSPAVPAKEDPKTAAPDPAVKASADIDKIISAKFEEWANKQTEAEKFAKMSETEKAEHTKKQQEDDYNKRMAELTKNELRIEAHKILTEKDLPLELLDVLQYSDADSCNASIASVETAFRGAVEKAVNDRLRGKAPGAGNPSALTMDQIKNMSRDEIMANYNEVEKVLANQ